MVTKAQRQDSIKVYTHSSRTEQASELTMTPALHVYIVTLYKLGSMY